MTVWTFILHLTLYAHIFQVSRVEMTRFLFIFLVCLVCGILCQYTPNDVKKAKEEVAQGRSVRETSRVYNIPRRTLTAHLAGERSVEAIGTIPNRYLSTEQENDLISYALWMNQRGWPLTTKLIMVLAGEIHRKATGEEGYPDIKWAQRFVNKNGFSFRTAAEHNRGKVASVTTDVINQHFDLLHQRLQTMGLLEKPQNIWNMDETGWSKGQQVKHKIVAVKGQKHPYMRKTYTMDHVTSVHGGNAAGEILPTMLIYKNTLPLWIRNGGLPSNWAFAASESGFINGDLFLLWLEEVFVKFLTRRPGPHILIIDNASPHLSLEAIDYCRKKNIELFAMPPNTSGILQPFDQIFYLLKSAFFEICMTFSLVSASYIVNKTQFAHILLQAQRQSLLKSTIQTAFRVTGIFPFNPKAVDMSNVRQSSSGEASTPRDTNEPSSSQSSSQPCSQKTPCSECGKEDPCSSCIVRNNPLVRLGIIKDPVCAEVLIAPTLKQTPSKPKRIKGARVLTGAEINDQITEKDDDIPPLPAPKKRQRKGKDQDKDVTIPPKKNRTRNRSTTDTSSPQSTSSLPSSSSLPSTSNVPSSTTNEPSVPSSSATLASSSQTKSKRKAQPKNKSSKKKSTKTTRLSINETTEDDFHAAFLCDLCGIHGRTMDNDADWVGCDNITTCGKWFHYDCLDYVDRTDVDLSLLTQSQWMCEDCKPDHGFVTAACPVCMVDICVATVDITDIAICNSCSIPHHKKCLTERDQTTFELCQVRCDRWHCLKCGEK